MPNEQFARPIDSKPTTAKTYQVLTELVSWDGVVRGTYTTFKVLDDGSTYPGDIIVVSRDSATNQDAADLLSQAYAMTEKWRAEDAQKSADDAAKLDSEIAAIAVADQPIGTIPKTP